MLWVADQRFYLDVKLAMDLPMDCENIAEDDIYFDSKFVESYVYTVNIESIKDNVIILHHHVMFIY